MNDKSQHLDLEALLCEIETDHEAVLAGKRQSIEHAVSAGARLDQIKQRIGHDEYGLWVKEHCALRPWTARLYLRLYRRLAEMPDMKEKILALTLNEADATLAHEREQRMFNDQLMSRALSSALCETARELADLINLARQRLGDQAWAAWDDPTARFVKPLADPPKSLCFPAGVKLRADAHDGPDEELSTAEA
jgi:hypothetical protein